MFVIGGGFFGLKYTERSHLRIKCRNLGLALRNFILQYKIAHNFINYASEYFLKQIVSLLDLVAGFIEGFIKISPLYELQQIEQIEQINQINQPDQLEQIEQIEQLEQIEQIEQIEQSNQLEQSNQVEQTEQIDNKTDNVYDDPINEIISDEIQNNIDKYLSKVKLAKLPLNICSDSECSRNSENRNSENNNINFNVVNNISEDSEDSEDSNDNNDNNDDNDNSDSDVFNSSIINKDKDNTTLESETNPIDISISDSESSEYSENKNIIYSPINNFNDTSSAPIKKNQINKINRINKVNNAVVEKINGSSNKIRINIKKLDKN